MKVENLITNVDILPKKISLLQKWCSQYLNESKKLPILKNLPSTYNDFQKVKVRTKKNENKFTKTFNEAFKRESFKLRQRSIFGNGYTSFEPAKTTKLEPFYIFPINGYDFMYCNEIENSNDEYKQTFDVLFEAFGTKKGKEVITDVLRFSYSFDNLSEGIKTGAEIIFFGIPYYYALKTSTIDSYNKLLSSI